MGDRISGCKYRIKQREGARNERRVEYWMCHTNSGKPFSGGIRSNRFCPYHGNASIEKCEYAEIEGAEE